MSRSSRDAAPGLLERDSRRACDLHFLWMFPAPG